MFDWMCNPDWTARIPEIIDRSVSIKRDVVRTDEFDNGLRQTLNLGHTFGHAIEKCSDYTISHGKAVAIGMAMICRAAKCPDTDRILGLLERFGLPTTTKLPATDLWQATLSDKKRSGDLIDMIVPSRIGSCKLVPTDTKSIKTFIEEGM
jgi:3-dehydroquinate synthase